MDRLSIYLTMMTGAVITGVFVIAAFSFGFYSWTAVLISAAIGYALSWPAAYVISRRIKQDDPEWDHTKIERTDAIPHLGEREV